MLVVASDLHLSDGTTGRTLDAGAVELLTDRLLDLAVRASWRADGGYRPLEQIDVVLLGDVIDLIHSNRWRAAGVRPWDEPASPRVADVTSQIVDGIIHQNRATVEALRAISTDQIVRVPPATQHGEPVYSAEGIPVPVRIHYLVGNHDWLLHLPGPRYDAIRQRIALQLGLASTHNEPFPHEPAESPELQMILRKHRVFARHGDIYDPLAFCEDRDAPSLGNVISIEIIERFLSEIVATHAADLPPNVVHGLAEIDQIRPCLLAPIWIEGLLQRSAVRAAVRKAVKSGWDQLVNDFLQLDIVRSLDAGSPFELLDGLEKTLKFSKRLSIDWANRVTNWARGLRGAETDSYFQHALSEPDFRNRRARHVVYGHTHQFDAVALDASFADGYVLNQMYFNAGTLRRVYLPTRATAEHEFIAVEDLSYLAFYHGDERGGRPFETWSGRLSAPAQSQAPARSGTLRTDSPRLEANPTLRSPHFGGSLAAVRRR